MNSFTFSARPSVLTLEARITPAYVAADVAAFVRDQRIVAGATESVGAIFSTWEFQGPAADPNQRVADPRLAGQAVLALLAIEPGSADNLATAQRYLQWYLLNVDSGNNFLIEQQWYRSGGTFVRTTPAPSESPYIATFFQVAAEYARLGGDRTIFDNPGFRSKIVTLGNNLLGYRQSDSLFLSTTGSTNRVLGDNAEIYAGLLGASRLYAEIYADQQRAFQFDTVAVNLRLSVQSNFYVGGSVGYGWTKPAGGPVVTTDDPANPWATQAVRLFPAIFGIDDPRGQRSTTQLQLLNTLYGAGGKDWATRFVDANNEPWTVIGYAQNLIAGDTARGNLHNDTVYDFRFAGNPARPINPLTSADAGWMLRTPGPFNLPPVADSQALTLDQGTSVPVTLTGTDPDGNPLRYTIVKSPSSGALTDAAGAAVNFFVYGTGNAFTYTPNPAFSGVDTLIFKVSDGRLDSELKTINLGVNSTGGPVVPPVVPPVGPPGLPPVVLPPVVPGVPPVPPVPPLPGLPPVTPPPAPGPLNGRSTLVTSPASAAITVVTELGQVRETIAPFTTATPGGVRATLVDLDGDGTPDYAAGTGPGVATAVVGLSGATQASLFRLAPFEASFTGGVFLAAGDLTGDGVPDLAVSPDQGGGPRVRIFDGVTRAPIVDFFGIDDPAFRGGARVAFGDVTGDGTPDLIVAAGFGGGPRVTIWDGAALLAGSRQQVANFFAFEPGLRNGVYVAAGTFGTGQAGNDNRAELVVGAGPGGGPRVSIFDGASLGNVAPTRTADFFAGDTESRGGVTVAVKPGVGPEADGPGDLLLAGSGPSDAVSKLRAYTAPAIAQSPTAPTANFDIEPLAGNAAGIYVG